MKKIIIILVILFSGIIFSGCGQQTTNQNLTVEKTGLLQTKSGDEYLLNTNEGIVNMTSNKVNLNAYMKKNVKVSGQFSGSTLYVDQITEN